MDDGEEPGWKGSVLSDEDPPAELDRASTAVDGEGNIIGGGGAPAAPHCLDGITDYDKPGPFTFHRKTVGLVNMWVPEVPKGCKVPMVHLANGTGAICGLYAPSLERLASHGFLALCFQSPITGGGYAGTHAFDVALKTFPELADLKFGSTGHSQGGQASFIILQNLEEQWAAKGGVFAGLAMQPASGFGMQPLDGLWPQLYNKIKSPVFMFSGLGTDGLVPQPWVTAAYLALNRKTEAYHWAKIGSLHIPVPNAEEMQISVPWFRWKLLGDKRACEYFKDIPKQDWTWLWVRSQNVASCD